MCKTVVKSGGWEPSQVTTNVLCTALIKKQMSKPVLLAEVTRNKIHC